MQFYAILSPFKSLFLLTRNGGVVMEIVFLTVACFFTSHFLAKVYCFFTSTTSESWFCLLGMATIWIPSLAWWKWRLTRKFWLVVAWMLAPITLNFVSLLLEWVEQYRLAGTVFSYRFHSIYIFPIALYSFGAVCRFWKHPHHLNHPKKHLIPAC